MLLIVTGILKVSSFRNEKTHKEKIYTILLSLAYKKLTIQYLLKNFIMVTKKGTILSCNDKQGSFVQV